MLQRIAWLTCLGGEKRSKNIDLLVSPNGATWRRRRLLLFLLVIVFGDRIGAVSSSRSVDRRSAYVGMTSTAGFGRCGVVLPAGIDTGPLLKTRTMLDMGGGPAV